SVNEKNIGNNTKEIINNLFDRLSLQSNHGEYLIRKTLSYIEASKYGLSEKELLELLSQKEIIQEYNTNIKSREAKEAGDVENLPHIILSRILADLNPYLSEISYNGIPLINFYHQQFSDVVQERYFTNEKKKREIHLDLANYFKNNLLLARTFDSKTINPRIVDELPWQYSYAEDYKQLIELITNMDFFQKLWNKDMFELNYFLSLIRNNLPTYSIKESFKKVVENNSQYNSYILIILGLFLTHGGLVYEAMKLFQEVEKRSRKNNDKEYLAVSLNNQGILLPQNSDSLDNAMELFKESEQLYRESNPKRVPESLVNQARTLLKQRKIDEATRIFKEIEETCNGSKNLHENNALQICLKDHGWMFEKSGEYDKAMELYRKSEIINRELHNRGGLSHSLYGIASVYFYKNDMYNAVKILKELEKLCREIGSEDILKECLSLKAKIIEINGGFDKGNEIRAEIKELMKKFEYENRQK
ncbi:MAG: hypothetical protein FWH29_09270, partial [Methanobrevibacter sp.]|nr:hypothetical protein [Methanobrevibacter sp.]